MDDLDENDLGFGKYEMDMALLTLVTVMMMEMMKMMEMTATRSILENSMTIHMVLMK